jgi:antitoxin VapB
MVYLSTMTLNIKNPEAHKLATELAKQTGESLTEAVTQALRERLARVKTRKPDQKLMEDMARIGRECAERLSPEVKAIDHGDYLYDEKGLPK